MRLQIDGLKYNRIPDLKPAPKNALVHVYLRKNFAPLAAKVRPTPAYNATGKNG
jgi:hypothetical protein